MRIEVIIAKRPIFNVGAFVALTSAALHTAGEGIKADFEATTASWDHDVEFTVEVGPGEVSVGTNDPIYALVNGGAPSHPIFPKKGRSLIFQGDYAAKTAPKYIGSRGGGKSGGIVFWGGGMHPGFEARNFDDTIWKKWDTRFYISLVKAVIEANL